MKKGKISEKLSKTEFVKIRVKDNLRQKCSILAPLG